MLSPAGAPGSSTESTACWGYHTWIGRCPEITPDNRVATGLGTDVVHHHPAGPGRIECPVQHLHREAAQ